MEYKKCPCCNGHGHIWSWTFEDFLNDEGEFLYEDEVSELEDCSECNGEGVVEVDDEDGD